MQAAGGSRRWACGLHNTGTNRSIDPSESQSERGSGVAPPSINITRRKPESTSGRAARRRVDLASFMYGESYLPGPPTAVLSDRTTREPARRYKRPTYRLAQENGGPVPSWAPKKQVSCLRVPILSCCGAEFEPSHTGFAIPGRCVGRHASLPGRFQVPSL